MAITAADVQNYLAANPGLSDAQIAAAMDAYGVSPATVAQATGLSAADVQSRYQSAGGGMLLDTSPQKKVISASTDPNIDPKYAADYTNESAIIRSISQMPAEVQQTFKEAVAKDPSNSMASIMAARAVLNKYPQVLNFALNAPTTSANQGNPAVNAAIPGMLDFLKQNAQTGVPDNVKAALTSPKLTQDQYNTLSAYFGNTNLPQDSNQIKDFVGKKTGFEFANYAATRDASQGGGNIQEQQQKLQQLFDPFKGTKIGVGFREVPDGDGTRTEQYVVDPITGQPTSLRLVDEANNLYAVDYGMLGRAASDPEKQGYKPQVLYQINPNTNEATLVGGGATMEQASGGFFEGLKPLVPMALAAVGVTYPGLGETLGASIGLSGTAASTVGNAMLSGLTTGVITGDAEKAFLAAALAGAGTYAVETGALGDVFDSVGLSDYKDTFGIKNSTQIANIGDVESQLGNFYGNTPTATYNPQTGLTGLADGRVVVEAGNASGIPAGTYTQQEFINQLGQTFPELANTGMLSNASNTNLGSGIKAPTNAGDMLGVGTADAGKAGGVAGGSGLTPGAAGVTGIGAGTAGAVAGAAAGGSTVAQAISDALGNKTLQGLLSTGIDYAKLNELQNLAQEQGAAARQQATEAGKLANIPFTPYTVTTGAGTTAFGTNAAGQPTAAVTASPEYEALRQQALAQAGQAYGAINPATATQDYYANLQALQAPQQQIAQEQLLSNLGAKGLLGIGRNLPTVGQAGTSAVNPYMQSLLASQRQADLQNAIASQQYGLQQAQGQAQLAGTLLGQGQNIDTAALQTLTQGAGLGSTATQLNQTGALRQLEATLQGQKLGTAYDLSALDAQSQAILAAAGAAKGMFGLPTTAGNTSSTNLAQQAVNYLGGIFS